MTIGIEADDKLLLVTGDVHLYSDDRDIASQWASKYIRSNPAVAWILGKYVEADRPNSNKQLWSLEDLQGTHAFIQNSPLNILHRPRYIVGAFAGAEVVYPTVEGAADESAHPYVEALAAFWKYYFPHEMKVVEAAYNAGQLAFSMECVAKTMTCAGEQGCGQEFAYAGPSSTTYCDHLNQGLSNKAMKEPLWLGGGLILPPARPGWKDAKVSEIGMDMQLADFVYAALQEEIPEGNPSIWEMEMIQVLARWQKLKKKKRSSAREFDTETRKKMAKEKTALPDGSFPIKNAEDLRNAIKLAGNAKNPAAARAHIKRRAKAMGMEHMIPDSWK